MSADVSRLKQAVELIRGGKLDKAQPILVEILRTEPDNSQAWYLLSFTASERKRKIYSLQQALRADPQFGRARMRLAELLGGPPETTNEAPGSKPVEVPSATKPIVAPAPQPPKTPESLFTSFQSLQPTATQPTPPKPENPESVFRDESEEPKPSSQGARTLLTVLGLVALFGVIFILSRDWFAGLLANSPPTSTEAQAFRPLPPTWTPTAAGESTAEATQQSNQDALQI
ncbi:MAG TPA: hypothetical protein VLK33_21625, partial [Terriglobales bacterium]|nr:hypothetical protein [Terriglobales bacterium]